MLKKDALLKISSTFFALQKSFKNVLASL